jgi:hypothetical protein
VKAVRQEYSKSGYRGAVRAMRQDAELQGGAVKTHLQPTAVLSTMPRSERRTRRLRVWSRRIRSLRSATSVAYYRRSNPGNVCSSRTQFRWSSATLVGMRLCYEMCLSFYTRLMFGHRFGAFPASNGSRSSASHGAPLWRLGSSQSRSEPVVIIFRPKGTCTVVRPRSS